MSTNRRSIINAAPTIIADPIPGGPSTSTNAAGVPLGASGVTREGGDGSFFERERERLIEEISGGFEELMSSTNVLNRKLEEVFGVGREFETVAGLWGKFNSLIREQKIDPIQDPDASNNSLNAQQDITHVPGTGSIGPSGVGRSSVSGGAAGVKR